MSSVQRFISHKKLLGERLAEPLARPACVRAMPQKGRSKQERQKYTIGCKNNAHKPLCPTAKDFSLV